MLYTSYLMFHTTSIPLCNQAQGASEVGGSTGTGIQSAWQRYFNICPSRLTPEHGDTPGAVGYLRHHQQHSLLAIVCLRHSTAVYSV